MKAELVWDIPGREGDPVGLPVVIVLALRLPPLWDLPPQLLFR